MLIVTIIMIVETCTELAVIDSINTEKKNLIFDKIKKSKKKIIIVASSVVALIIVFIITFSVFISPMLKYNNAKTLMEQKNYSEAKAELKQLSDYNDSKELYKECEYNEAVKNMKKQGLLLKSLVIMKKAVITS